MVHRKSFMETRRVSEGESSCRFSLAYASGYLYYSCDEKFTASTR